MNISFKDNQKLKNGLTIRLRRARPSDASGITKLERALIEDGRGMVQSREDLLDLEDRVFRRLQHKPDPTRELTLVATDELHKVLALGHIARMKAGLLQHVGELSLGVHPQYQRQGLGRLVTEGLIAWAKGQESPLIRLELSVRSDNPRAQALYRSLGFEQEGVRKRFVRLADGSFVDDLPMALFLDQPQGNPSS